MSIAINIPLLAELKTNPTVQKNFCTTQLVDSHIDQIRANYGFGQIQCKIKLPPEFCTLVAHSVEINGAPHTQLR